MPDPGHIFLGWSGGATASTNPISLLMDGSKVVAARFVQAVRFLPSLNKWSGGGFSLSFTGQVGVAYELQASSNFLDWTSVAPLLNETGRVTFQHTDAVTQPNLFYRVLGP